MVSLVNFKSVSDDLNQTQQRLAVTCATNQPAANSRTNNSSGNQVQIFQQHPQRQGDVDGSAADEQDQTAAGHNRMQNLRLVVSNPGNNQQQAATANGRGKQTVSVAPVSGMFCPLQLASFAAPERGSPQIVACQPTCETTNFVITWRKLRFAIEPKWHQRLASVDCLTSVAASFGRRQQKPSTSPAPAIGYCTTIVGLDKHPPSDRHDDFHLQVHQHQTSSPTNEAACQQQQQPETKVVLDLLDGSFKSGELTAILGPSGAGKTTLLDCLTGHRKHGLSGSIRISSASAAAGAKCCSCYCCSPALADNNSAGGSNHAKRAPPANHSYSSVVATPTSKSSYSKQKHHHHRQQQQQQQQQQHHQQQLPQTQTQGVGNGDNLKVSIIPQNDHLMGHLTVFETLNYASKMKNCFDSQFDHKLNIRRVAQQLGLMSCLATRINKLSGGQYKRVSIAQELLSSPDILILDEPTSGLDAMTCYQTVQVLRKLTDDRLANGQKQIAVILTIHQPNSDVFQQFNHVYVVAQGGKCIYEGPPSSIESVINRVGIRLPNSYYNPATMIVEIAAGKFGTEAILELNEIQKKQYDCVVVPDEQTSTGDSAVDCPSTSSSAPPSTASNDEDDCDEEAHGYGKQQAQPRSQPAEVNNNSTGLAAGLVNEGFVMDQIEPNNNGSGYNGTGKEVIVIVNDDAADPVGRRMKMITSCGGDASPDLAAADNRRKKRRRTRKRSGGPMGEPAAAASGPIVCSSFSIKSGAGGGGNSADGNGGGGSSRAEKRLKLNSLKADQKFPFWRHTYLHFHRSWLSIVRDPMLCSMQLALHIIVPVMVSLVYGTNVGKPNACPRAGPMDIMAYALEPTDSALQLQEDLRTTLENIGYIFFKLYGIIFAAMTVTVLTFPLDMHVLVKEFRNGWYGLSSYFLGRTLADIPFQLTLPLLAMSLSYYATGQPYSYMQWRFLSITGILILSSLIAQSQGLLFGAILMDRMKAAVFVAPAATTPIILFAGFLVRTQSIPHYLRPLSNLSYLRYAIEACLISRYGFNQCECDPATFNQTVPELPPIARSMLDYWLSSFKTNQANEAHEAASGSANSSALVEATTMAGQSEQANPDLFTKLLDSLGKANSFGRNITSCDQVVPYPMIDYDLKDSQLFSCFAILIFMLVFTRLLTFFIVCFKVKRKV